jgi:hypothetical protein
MSLMFRSLKPDDPCYANWAEMRRRTRLFWIAFFTWAPLTALLLASAELAFGAPSAWVAAPGVLAVFVARIYQVLWPCPRCEKPFYSYGGWLYWPFADRCLHCDLPEHSPRAEG